MKQQNEHRRDTAQRIQLGQPAGLCYITYANRHRLRYGRSPTTKN
jgi:hypothetical protein